ncbi:YihY/virulence factor BrkB family protein [Lapillicoccus jejuensis]|uniref:Membrane protein n=1 Tax=Lapillicoccus jejuensis TaxID=402171 RepID=A0A542E253_9MICO|nr:YihY/virulence factor BrkB family protein [Lapillicoccus jejuensis]TQJ09406.1 membrane protein [Lapillicoccus jejuensis]
MDAVKQAWARFQRTRGWQAWTRFGEARGNLLASGVAFYAFFSVFPAAALAAAILGLVLRNNPQVVDSLTRSLADNLPGLVKTPTTPDGIINLTAPSLSVVTVSGIVGVVGLVLSGVGWVGGLRDGIRTVFGLTGSPGNVVTQKLRDLGVLGSLGLAVVVSATLTSLTGALGDLFAGVVGKGVSAVLVTVIGLAVGLGIDFAIMIVSLRILGGAGLSVRQMRTGALVTAVGLTVVKFFGLQLIANATKSPLLGSVALVVGLLFWFNLIAKLTLVGAAWVANDNADELAALAARLQAEKDAQGGESEREEAGERLEGRTTPRPPAVPVPPARKDGRPTAARAAATSVAASVVTPAGAPAIAQRRGRLVLEKEARIAAADDRAAQRAAAADPAVPRDRAVGGLPTFGDRERDRTSLAAGAVLGATAALGLGSLARGVRALLRVYR